MTKTMTKQQIKHEFVEFIPEKLQDHTLYISIEYDTASHKCACGCGHEVVTPISPKDWQLNYNGETVSLHPSIGNWSFECRSHYWIKNGQIVWAEAWSQDRVDMGRAHDKMIKNMPAKTQKRNLGFWQRFTKFLGL